MTADFNGDGKSDLAVTDYGATLSILLGNGNGLFQLPQTTPLVGPGKAVDGMLVVGDFNGDGKPDLAATSRDGVSVFLGNGNESFQGAVTYYQFLGGAIAVGDLNGDGRPDLVMANYSSDATTTDTVAILTSVVLVPVTVTTSPAGLFAVIDGGGNCTTPCVVIMDRGSVHNISVYAYPPASGGARYHFISWSDGGGISHAITVPATPVTYTATYGTQYLLTIGASPGGTARVLNPGVFDVGGFANAGQSCRSQPRPTSEPCSPGGPAMWPTRAVPRPP